MDGFLESGALALRGALSDPKDSIDDLSKRADAPHHRDHAGHGCCMDPHGVVGARSLVGEATVADCVTGEITGRRAVALPLRCRTWTCSCCAARLRRKYRARAFKGLDEQARYALVTLTIDPEDGRWIDFLDRWDEKYGLGDGVLHLGRRQRHGSVGFALAGGDVVMEGHLTRASIRYVAKCWNNLNRALKRTDWGAGVQYYKALELQKNGRAHLHVVIRGQSLPEVWQIRTRLRALAVEQGFGGRAGRGMGFDVDRLHSKKAAAEYISKVVKGRVAGYTGKATDWLPKYTRRFSWSQSWSEWVPPTRIAGFGWRLAWATVPTVTRALEASGVVVDDPARYRVGLAAMAAGGVE